MPAGIFEAVEGAGEIGVYEITDPTTVASMNRRLGRTLDQQIGRRQAFEILGAANVAVDKSDAASTQSRQRQLAAAPMQIVKARHHRIARPGKRQREVRPYETGSPSDQNAH